MPKYDPKKSIYQDQRKLPPEWYSKIEAFISNNWKLFLMITWFLWMFVWPFFNHEPITYLPDYPPR